MREEGLLNHRGRARQIRKKLEVSMLEARGIKQVLAWDITLLPSPIIGRYYYLYMDMDVWSRHILGVEVHGEQCGKLAGEFIDRICRDEKTNKVSATCSIRIMEPTAITYISCKNERTRNITLILKAKGQ